MAATPEPVSKVKMAAKPVSAVKMAATPVSAVKMSVSSQVVRSARARVSTQDGCHASTSALPVPPNGNELCLVFLEMPNKLLPPRFYLAHSESTLATGD
ncbi:hypothetical protein E1301_Tti010421 [Triplophysa tibetana]|uniref:Uncharacterized protein n=1 Tax=Triplophysa tibetana TaxID=1572043 RepID=A0A5A9PUG4_9TELE|nr:hypothetical protein E1301_Tti010421 [Triplophysa tibetana]